MLPGIPQILIIVLTVDVRDPGSQCGDLTEGDQLSVQTAQILSCGGNLPGDHIILTVERGGQLNDGFIFSAAHKRRVCPRSQRQTHGFNHNGFTGACFARDDVQTVFKFNLCIFDDRKILY